jgi:hypothetical protein
MQQSFQNENKINNVECERIMDVVTEQKRTIDLYAKMIVYKYRQI